MFVFKLETLIKMRIKIIFDISKLNIYKSNEVLGRIQYIQKYNRWEDVWEQQKINIGGVGQAGLLHRMWDLKFAS